MSARLYVTLRHTYYYHGRGGVWRTTPRLVQNLVPDHLVKYLVYHTSLDEAKCSLNEAKCSLDEAKCSLNDAKCSLNEAKCSLDEAKCSLNEVKCSLNEPNVP